MSLRASQPFHSDSEGIEFGWITTSPLPPWQPLLFCHVGYGRTTVGTAVGLYWAVCFHDSRLDRLVRWCSCCRYRLKGLLQRNPPRQTPPQEYCNRLTASIPYTFVTSRELNPRLSDVTSMCLSTDCLSLSVIMRNRECIRIYRNNIHKQHATDPKWPLYYLISQLHCMKPIQITQRYA